MRPSSRDRALESQTMHAFVPGVGYLREGPADILKMGEVGKDHCTPPAGTADGTLHILASPSGAQQIAFMWVEAEQAWSRHGGRRMAFTAHYLSSHGWTYEGPAA